MKYKVLELKFNDEFECIGGACPLTCCVTSWKILLSDEEIEMYRHMDNNYKKTIVESIDMESKCFKGKNGKCALLTEDGWCNIVKYCGDEYLSKTCSIFPRRVVSYGDIIERCFEPVCPVIAKKNGNR